MSPHLRLATECDAERVLEMMREYYAFDGHAFEEAKARAALLGLVREAGLGQVWLICDQETEVGYLVLTFGYSLEFLGRDAFVDEFFLREPYRGRGWGREALQLAEREARAVGVNALHLEVVSSNDAANGFYRKAGFQDRGHHLMSKWISQELAKPVHGS